MIVPVVVHNGELELTTYALLDDGADTTIATIATNKLAEELTLNCRPKMATLHTVEGSSYKERHMVDFSVSNLDSDLRIEVRGALVSSGPAAARAEAMVGRDHGKARKMGP